MFSHSEKVEVSLRSMGLGKGGSVGMFTSKSGLFKASYTEEWDSKSFPRDEASRGFFARTRSVSMI